MRKVLLGCLLAFMLLVGFRLHGFSITPWHDHLDQSPHHELRFSIARKVRSDDWMVQLPTNLAQAVSPRPFSVFNANVGTGESDLRLMHGVPIAHWSGVFRPESFGYFLGSDTGLAWQWWYGVIGLFASFYLVLLIVTRERMMISAAGAALLVYSPFLQYWSLNSAPLLIAGNLLFVAINGFILARTSRELLLRTLLGLWAAGCFLFFLYPPYQIPLAYLLAALTAGSLLRARGTGKIPLPQLKFAALAAGILLLGAMALQFLTETSESFEILKNSVTGARRLSGGDLPLGHLFLALAIPNSWNNRWEAFGGNVCEAAGFLFFFPLTMAILGLSLLRFRKQRPDPLQIALGAFVVLNASWILLGFPSWFAEISLWNRSQPSRAMLALGMADIALLATFLAAPPRKLLDDRKLQRAFLLAWALFLGWVFFRIHSMIPGVPARIHLPIAWLLLVGVAWQLLRGKRSAIILLAILTWAFTLRFNPLVQGGADYLRENPFAQKVLELEKGLNRPGTWVHYGDLIVSNVYRMIGVHSLGGNHFLTQSRLWSVLDPEAEYRYATNRYAHVYFEKPDSTGRTRIEAPGDADVVRVHLDPDSVEFRRLGADFVVVTAGEPDSYFLSRKSLQPVATVGNFQIFSVRSPVPRENSSGDPRSPESRPRPPADGKPPR